MAHISGDQPSQAVVRGPARNAARRPSLFELLGADRWDTFKRLDAAVVKAVGADADAIIRRVDEIHRLQRTARGMPAASDLARGYTQRIGELLRDPSATVESTGPVQYGKGGTAIAPAPRGAGERPAVAGRLSAPVTKATMTTPLGRRWGDKIPESVRANLGDGEIEERLRRVDALDQLRQAAPDALGDQYRALIDAELGQPGAVEAAKMAAAWRALAANARSHGDAAESSRCLTEAYKIDKAAQR